MKTNEQYIAEFWEATSKNTMFIQAIVETLGDVIPNDKRHELCGKILAIMQDYKNEYKQ